jgi:hypothetical protein
MSLLLNLLVSLGFAAAVGAAVHFWRAHLETARRDGMQALAARRGWALTVTGERLGRAGTLRIVPRGGTPWLAEARPKRAPDGPVTEYEAEAPRWAEGTLVMVAAPLPGPVEPGALPDSRLMSDLLGDEVARLAGLLHVVPAPDRVTALADADPSRRVDLAEIGGVLTGWAPVTPGPRGRPVLILSRGGLRLRLRHPIQRPEQMERFLDLALELSRRIGR